METKTKSLAITKECAEAFFEVCGKNGSCAYCATESYVVFAADGVLLALHKQTAQAKIVSDEFGAEECERLFKKKLIATDGDKIYLIAGEKIYCYDLESESHSEVENNVLKRLKLVNLLRPIAICAISLPLSFYEKRQDCTAPQLSEIFEKAHHLTVSGDTLVFASDKIYIYTMKDGGIEKIETLDSNAGGYDLYLDCGFSLYNGCLYFVQETVDGSLNKFGYQIVRYVLDSKKLSRVSEPFNTYKPFSRYSDVLQFYVYRHYMCVVVGWHFSECTPEEWDGYNGYCIDISGETADVHEFFFWQSHIYQIEFFGRYIIYNNATKNYTVFRHDFISDRRKPLLKKYGETEKAPILEKLTFGLSEYQHPKRYARLGKWIKYGDASGVIDLNGA